MQPEFVMPDFLQNNSAEEIHERMMNNLPEDIDDMPGGFPFDFTKPAALEKEEIINFHLVRALMICFPQYAYDEWLDLHGQQVHLKRHPPEKASGYVMVSGMEGTLIASGTIFCTPASDTGPSIMFSATEPVALGSNGTAQVAVTAVESGSASNVAANTVTLMTRPDKNVASVTNPEPIRGGKERESNNDYYDRIAMEYDNSRTYLGNDADFIRWAMQAGAGDAIVVPCAEGPGTVKLVLVDGDGKPADENLVQDVYDYIISPGDRSARFLPTASAHLICVPATTVKIDFTISGLLYDGATSIRQIEQDFSEAVKAAYILAKQDGILRYNDVRPLINDIVGVIDYDSFLMDGDTKNISLSKEEYPETGNLDFS